LETVGRKAAGSVFRKEVIAWLPKKKFFVPGSKMVVKVEPFNSER